MYTAELKMKVKR